MRLANFLLSLVLGCVLALHPAEAEQTTLASGAGFRRPLVELVQQYEQQSGHKVLQVYGHVGQVVAQARENNEIGLLCGDKAVFEKAAGLTFGSWVPLGNGKLVLAFRKEISLQAAAEISRNDIARIAIPDQANAIYGKAGRQFLERSGLAEKVNDRLVPVATVPQVTSYLVSGDVDAGFINATEAIGAGNAIGGFVEIPADLYDPVEVACAVRANTDNAALKGFVTFLATPQARAVLGRFGL